MTVSVDNFFLFFHHEILKYVSTHVQIFRVPYRTRFGNNHGFIPRGQSFSHALCKFNELTCAYMFSQAHLQKNTHKKVSSLVTLVEISNIYCVFLLRNANIFSFAC